jgi:ferredoxin
MSLRIGDDCINCAACADACPTEAIFEDEENDVSVIDSRRCTECVGFYERTMCAVECPVECIDFDPENPETEEQLLNKANRLMPNHEFPYPPPSHLRRQ